MYLKNLHPLCFAISAIGTQIFALNQDEWNSIKLLVFPGIECFWQDLMEYIKFSLP
jgi:hypothetical protein